MQLWSRQNAPAANLTSSMPTHLLVAQGVEATSQQQALQAPTHLVLDANEACREPRAACEALIQARLHVDPDPGAAMGHEAFWVLLQVLKGAELLEAPVVRTSMVLVLRVCTTELAALVQIL